MNIKIKPSSFTYKQLSEMYQHAEIKINKKANRLFNTINIILEAAILFVGLEYGSYIMRAQELSPERAYRALGIALMTVIVLLIYEFICKDKLYELFSKKYTMKNVYDTLNFHKYKHYLDLAEQIQRRVASTDYAKVTVYNNELLLTTGSVNVSSTVPYDFDSFTKRILIKDGLDFSILDENILTILSAVETEELTK